MNSLVRLPEACQGLERAIDRKDLQSVEALLNAKPDLLADMENNGRTPLHKVIAYRYFLEAVPALIRAGAAIDRLDAEKRTPLLEALFPVQLDAPTMEAVTALLQAGANVNAQDGEGNSVLHLAVGRPDHQMSEVDVAIIRLLLAHGADDSLLNYRGDTPLASAYYCANPRAVRILRHASAPFANGDDPMPSPLQWAIAENDLSTVHTLLDAGADIEQRDAGDATPLHAACRGGCGDIVHLLLACGADIDATAPRPDFANSGVLPLHTAAHQTEVTQILLDAGANPSILVGEFTPSPVEYAVYEGSPAVVRLYRDRQVPMSQEKLDNLLRDAAHLGVPEMVSVLLEWGAGKDQATLQRAVRAAQCCYHTENIEPLLAAGVHLCVNEAVLYGKAADVQASLIRNGDANEIYADGMPLTAAQFVQWREQMEALGLTIDGRVSTPIFNAAKVNDIEIAHLLLDRGADPDFLTGEIGDAALYSAIEHDNAAFVALLLEHGANLRVSKPHCSSPLELAEYWKYDECADLLRKASA